jgi:hypothetical protein
MRTPESDVVGIGVAEPEMKWAPAATALEIRASTRVLEAVFTRVGGWVEVAAPAARAFWRASVKAVRMEVWTRIRSVAMQIWPD